MKALALFAALLMTAPAAARDAPWLVAVPSLADAARALAGPAARIDVAEDEEAAVLSYCRGLGAHLPDALLLTRRLLDREQRQCATEAIASDPARLLGIVGLAVDGPLPDLTRAQLWRALAGEVPADGTLAPNRSRRWREVDPDLPDLPITLRLEASPDLVSGLILSVGCLGAPGFAKLDRARLCTALRTDLPQAPDAVVIGALRPDGLAVEGVKPAAAEIAAGRYPLARRVYLYVKQPHVPGIPGLAALLTRPVPGLQPAP
jgi:phosphate transport system substrate-binding protein